MTSASIDTVVVGAGLMGACTAWQLAERGREVLVVDRFEAGHVNGSSHGNARIFRLAYADLVYASLAAETVPLWAQLEADSGRVLVRRCGELDHGDPAEIAAIAATLAGLGVDHERLDPDQVADRFPGLRCDRAAVLHGVGGTLHPDATVAAALELADQAGATIRRGREVAITRVADDHVVLALGDEAITARTVVVAAGAWTAPLLAGHLRLPRMTITREQPLHFDLDGTTIDQWPSFIHYSGGGPAQTSGVVEEPVWGYGLPSGDGRIKLGEHHTGRAVATVGGDTPGPGPSIATTTVDETSLRRVCDYAKAWLPGIDPSTAEPEHCLYTSTPSTDFVIDRIGPLAVATGFSGHGAKFAPRIGQLLANMVDGTELPHDRFRLATHRDA